MEMASLLDVHDARKDFFFLRCKNSSEPSTALLGVLAPVPRSMMTSHFAIDVTFGQPAGRAKDGREGVGGGIRLGILGRTHGNILSSILAKLSDTRWISVMAARLLL